jgi:FkbM family methyltransferase
MSQVALELIVKVFHRAPIQSGLTRLSFNRFLNYLMAGGPDLRRARLRDGNWIEVKANDYHGRILFLFGTNDPKVEQTANALLQPGDVFLDIGANYASIGLSASHVVGSRGSVHLFEPQKKLADSVQIAIDAGGFANVHLHRVGLLDRDDKLVLRSPSYHSGMATFARAETGFSFEVVEECEVKEISAYVGPLIEGRRFGAKVDVEGSEPAIMPWLLAQPNLAFLIFEAASNQDKLYRSVRDAGLLLYGLARHPLKLIASRVDQFSEMSKFHDLVAVKLVKGPKEIHPRGLSQASNSK